jgi:ABC-type uncharacterized transport system involved in gliding motility auxiliary subunit
MALAVARDEVANAAPRAENTISSPAGPALVAGPYQEGKRLAHPREANLILGAGSRLITAKMRVFSGLVVVGKMIIDGSVSDGPPRHH